MREVSYLVLFLLLLSIFQKALYCQTPPYYHYTSDDGLGTSTVFDMIQDRDGYIWFATLNGISKFNGSSFRNYTVKDGLNSNNITCLTEGKDGCIYIGNYNKGINIIKENIISNYYFNGNRNPFINYLMIKDENLLSYHYVSLCEIKRFLLRDLMGQRKNFPDEFKLNKFIRSKEGIYTAATSKGFYTFENDTFSKLNIEGFDNEEVFCVTQDLNDNIMYAGLNGKILIIKDQKVINEIRINLFKENKVFRILKDIKGNIWFSILNKGFYLIPFGTNEIVDIGAKLGLQNSQVNCFFEDNENNIWACTFGDGVYCLNNLFLKNYGKNDGLSNKIIYALSQDKFGRIIAGTFNGLNFLENNKFTNIKINSLNNITDYIQNIKVFEDTVYICGVFNINQPKEIVNNGVKFLFLPSSNAFCRTSDKYYNGEWSNFITIRNISDSYNSRTYDKMYIFGDEMKRNIVNDIFEDSDKNLWVITSLGACEIKNKVKYLFSEDKILGSSLNAITEDKNKVIWLAGDKGIASYDLSRSVITDYSNLSGYDLTSSTSLVFDKKQRLWIGNKKGLFCWDGFNIRYLNNKTGLPSDEVNSLFYDTPKNVLWIGTGNGLTSLDVEYFEKYKPPELSVKLKSISAGDSTYYKFNDLKFETDEHDIKILYETINFSAPRSIVYCYNLNEDSVTTLNNYIEYNSMTWGNYEINIRAKSPNGTWSMPANIRFTIKSPYYVSVWFYAVLLIFTITIISSAAALRIRYNRKKIHDEMELNKAMNELKHQALSAMMNPHFIFNSLNSVQHLINTDNKVEANRYISLMARLIRMNLDTARESYIKLSEEVKRLEIYLSIEKLRFIDKINYNIDLGIGINPEFTLIPNMIIQPFVENAILHGLASREENGFVKIAFDMETVISENNSYRYLMIRISDNGIGIENAKKLNKENHVSKGIKIVEERLTLLSKEMGITGPIFIDNLKKLSSSSKGTEIIISLPPSLYQILQ